MTIPCVEELHKLELETMPLVAQMLFPPESAQRPEPKGDKPPRPTSDFTRLRRGWLARRSFVAMESIHRMTLRSTSEFYGGTFPKDDGSYVLSKFNNYLTRHGGWLNIIQDAAHDCDKDMKSMTFDQASMGFISGHVLKYCLEHACSTQNASEYVADNIFVDRYSEFSIEGSTDSSSYSDDRLKLETLNYTCGYIRTTIWNRMRYVSYAWAAAIDIFRDASTFTHRMISFSKPFEITEAETGSRIGFEHFSSLAKRYYSLATSRRLSPKRNLPPVINSPFPCLFD